MHTNCSCPNCCPEKYMTPMPFVPYISQPVQYNPPVNYGWVCPCCQSVYAPSVSKCFTCPNKMSVTVTEGASTSVIIDSNIGNNPNLTITKTSYPVDKK